MTLTKIFFILAALGHCLCAWCDILLTYTPNGKFSFKMMSSNEKMRQIFKGTPLRNSMMSIGFGFVAMCLSVCGYMALASYVNNFSHTLALLIFAGVLLGYLAGIPHHIICGLCEWIYIKFDCSDQSRLAITDMFKKTSFTMILCYLGQALFSIAFFVAVVAGITPLPRWACLFNILPLVILLSACRLPGAGNFAGAIQFLVLVFLV